MAEWKGKRLGIIARMAAEGYTDAEIGERFGVEGGKITQVRHYYKIPTTARVNTAAEPPARKIETVTVGGVTYCSPGWATGATSDHRVRPRRK